MLYTKLTAVLLNQSTEFFKRRNSKRGYKQVGGCMGVSPGNPLAFVQESN